MLTKPNCSRNLFLPIAFLLMIVGCQTPATDTAAVPEEVEIDRDMFGHRVERGLKFTSNDVQPGYVLFVPTNSALVYLMNREGEIVHEWKGNYGVMGAYLQDDGSLFQNAYDPDFPVFAGGGETGRIQQISWEGKILWDFEYATEEYHAHHDFAVMPNGNVLAIAWEAISNEEAIAMGRKPEYTPEAGVWPNRIVEINPQGSRGGEIVWEWHIWDHLVQNEDPQKPNYGEPGEHPELLDVNIDPHMPPPISADSMERRHAAGMEWRNQTVDNRGSDIYHFNAINYNAELDQIALSSPNLCEIIIIDHSTTTAEAASHSGGRWGKGGDFLYRWGNPQNYQRGDSTDQQLFHQHDVRWIEAGKPGAGNLTIYNNDIPGEDEMNYSAIYEITPPTSASGSYVIEEGTPYGPETPTWLYVAPDTISFWGSFISGAHRMVNGNTFINEGPKGHFFEVTPGGEIVWDYYQQYRGEIREPNGDPIPPMPFAFIQFRSTFIPEDHPALEGKELKPMDPQPEEFKLPPPPKSS